MSDDCHEAVRMYTEISFNSWWTSYFVFVELTHPQETVKFDSFDRDKAEETVSVMKRILKKYTFYEA